MVCPPPVVKHTTTQYSSLPGVDHTRSSYLTSFLAVPFLTLNTKNQYLGLHCCTTTTAGRGLAIAVQQSRATVYRAPVALLHTTDRKQDQSNKVGAPKKTEGDACSII